MSKKDKTTRAQISSLRALAQKYGEPIRRHQEKDGNIVCHCQRPQELSAKLFRIHPDGLTELI